MAFNYLKKSEIPLLKFALDKRGVLPTSYIIAERTDGSHNFEDKFVLIKEDSFWVCFYQERGRRSGVARFQGLRDAVKYMYWRLSSQPGPWAYREEWTAAGCPGLDEES